MRVKGSNGSVFAFGDACTIDQEKALAHADELFELADVNKVRLRVGLAGGSRGRGASLEQGESLVAMGVAWFLGHPLGGPGWRSRGRVCMMWMEEGQLLQQ
jgi:hypothetical protein